MSEIPSDLPDPNRAHQFVQGIALPAPSRESANELRDIAADMEALKALPLGADHERAAANDVLNRLCVRAARVIAKYDPKMPHPYGPYADDTNCRLLSWQQMTWALANVHPEKVGSSEEFGGAVATTTEDNRPSFTEWPPTKPGQQVLVRSASIAYPIDSAARVIERIRDHVKACKLFADLIGREKMLAAHDVLRIAKEFSALLPEANAPEGFRPDLDAAGNMNAADEARLAAHRQSYRMRVHELAARLQNAESPDKEMRARLNHWCGEGLNHLYPVSPTLGGKPPKLAVVSTDVLSAWTGEAFLILKELSAGLKEATRKDEMIEAFTHKFQQIAEGMQEQQRRQEEGFERVARVIESVAQTREAVGPTPMPVLPTPMSTKPPTNGKPELRSWTQTDLDNAIRRYKAERAASYADLCGAVKQNKAGARKNAKEIYGRNAIARALGVKSKAMVSKSPAWVAIAQELGLPLNRSRLTQGTRHTQRPGKIAHEIAVEEKSATPEEGADNAPAEQPLETAERQETIRRINAMARAGKNAKAKADNQTAADNLIQRLQRGDCTDEQARQIVEMVLKPNG